MTIWREMMRSLLTNQTSSSLFGFFLGSSLAGAGVYSYILQEYKTSNELLTEDIYVRNSISLSACLAAPRSFPRPSPWSLLRPWVVLGVVLFTSCALHRNAPRCGFAMTRRDHPHISHTLTILAMPFITATDPAQILEKLTRPRYYRHFRPPSSA